VPQAPATGVPVVRDGERVVWLAGVRMSDEHRSGRIPAGGAAHMDEGRVATRAPIRDMDRSGGCIPDLDHIVLSEDRSRQRIAELGEEISRDYGEESILLIAVLRGAALFVADLARNITSPVEIDFMAVSSYGSSTQSSGVVRIIKDLEETHRRP
jgi:hypothetical protein